MAENGIANYPLAPCAVSLLFLNFSCFTLIDNFLFAHNNILQQGVETTVRDHINFSTEFFFKR